VEVAVIGSGTGSRHRDSDGWQHAGARIGCPWGVAQALSTARGKEVQGRSLRTPILFVDRSIAPRNFRAQATIAFRFASLSS